MKRGLRPALLACMPAKARLPEFRRDPEAALLAFHRELPDGAALNSAGRVSKVIGTNDYPLVVRPVAPRPGLALVGDAALTSDPIWGVGCGWAFQTGEWLADTVGPALLGESVLEAGLRRYRRRHRAIRGHHFLIADAASARRLNPVERLMFAAAARDDEAARHLEAFGTRRIPVRRFLAPTAIAHAAWTNIRHRARVHRDASRPTDGVPRGDDAAHT